MWRKESESWHAKENQKFYHYHCDKRFIFGWCYRVNTYKTEMMDAQYAT